jgi:hypothetical protein
MECLQVPGMPGFLIFQPTGAQVNEFVCLAEVVYRKYKPKGYHKDGLTPRGKNKGQLTL